MSVLLDQLTSLLLTASTSDAAIGVPIRDTLVAAEAAAATLRAFRVDAQEQFVADQAAFIPVRLAAFNAADHAARAAETALLAHPTQGFALAPDVPVPADFTDRPSVASVTLLGLVQVTANERGAFGNTVTAEIVARDSGFECIVRRGAFFQELLAITSSPTVGIIATVRQIAPGSVSAAAATPLTGGTGGAIASVLNRLRRARIVGGAVRDAIDAQVAALTALQPPVLQQPATVGELNLRLLRSGQERFLVTTSPPDLDDATARARDFVDYLSAL